MNSPRNVAQSVTRRAALKKFGLGLAGMGLACSALRTSSGGQGLRDGCFVT
jgi:hypothetical protein